MTKRATNHALVKSDWMYTAPFHVHRTSLNGKTRLVPLDKLTDLDVISRSRYRFYHRTERYDRASEYLRWTRLPDTFVWLDGGLPFQRGTEQKRRIISAAKLPTFLSFILSTRPWLYISVGLSLSFKLSILMSISTIFNWMTFLGCQSNHNDILYPGKRGSSADLRAERM